MNYKLYKFHYKNEDSKKIYSNHGSFLDYDEAYAASLIELDWLNTTKEEGYRVVGIYEILYPYKQDHNDQNN